jgi:hypothetical protein
VPPRGPGRLTARTRYGNGARSSTNTGTGTGTGTGRRLGVRRRPGTLRNTGAPPWYRTLRTLRTVGALPALRALRTVRTLRTAPVFRVVPRLSGRPVRRTAFAGHPLPLPLLRSGAVPGLVPPPAVPSGRPFTAVRHAPSAAPAATVMTPVTAFTASAAGATFTVAVVPAAGTVVVTVLPAGGPGAAR